MRHLFVDDQQALSFLRNQLAIQEPGFYRIVYPQVQYPGLVPVAPVGWEWAKSVTYTSLDTVGRAQWIHGGARDFPTADVVINQFEKSIEMAGIGYRWGIEELAVAMRLGIPLDTEKANAARQAAEEFIDDIVLRGSVDKGYLGLINQTTITTADAAPVGNQNGGTNSPYWKHKTPQQIMDDINSVVSNVIVSTLQVEMANTLLLPLEMLTLLAQTAWSTNMPMTLLEWVQAHNMYTLQTGNPMTITSIRGLEHADDAGGGRAVLYNKDPGVLRFHMPMPHKFLTAYQENPMTFFVPGIFRIGGLDIRRPAAMRYLDGISAPPTP